ncbi:MAG: TRAP transporter substrate-binding protein [Synergistetes bacterium]|nr:TRAP transporter substrate-binding protein [Synergistota bacterium]MCX8127409.1 TRAP transporter substrate-binding protein [Synergistota bacterium]MDW8192273.1 TRAP transporter substrate-binding protein [Synergistota bacterium]
MKKLLLISVFLGLIIGLGNPLNSAEGVIKLSYANFFPPSHIQSILAESWIKEVGKRSNGKVEISYFPGGALLQGPNIFEGVLNGIADIGMSCFAYTSGRFPLMEAVDLPLGYPDGTTATKVINRYFNMINPKELSGVKVLYLHAHGPGILHSKIKINKLEDLKGLKIRTTGFSAKVAKALGGVPVAMSQGMAYEALQKGIVEATFAPMETLKGWKQAEVIKHTIMCTKIGYTTGMYVVMNQKKWENLPEDVKKILEEISIDWVEKHGKAWDESDLEGKEFTLSLGNEIISLPDDEHERWRKAVEPVIDEYMNEIQKKGVPGKEAIETLKKLIKEETKK